MNENDTFNTLCKWLYWDAYKEWCKVEYDCVYDYPENDRRMENFKKKTGWGWKEIIN